MIHPFLSGGTAVGGGQTKTGNRDGLSGSILGQDFGPGEDLEAAGIQLEGGLFDRLEAKTYQQSQSDSSSLRKGLMMLCFVGNYALH